MAADLVTKGGRDAGAVFSADGEYRYLLWRRWSSPERILGWMMLNPSTADETTLDPTLRRCKGFSQRWGYSGMVVANLYQYRTSQTAELDRCEQPLGVYCMWALEQMWKASASICVAWGAYKPKASRLLQHRLLVEDYAERLRRYGVAVCCLGHTADNSPRHPLYLRADTEPEPWLGMEYSHAGS